jgi:hypothetical protein
MRGKAGIPLLKQLNLIDPNVKTEFQFEWLFLPKSDERTTQEGNILKSLWEDCKSKAVIKFKNKYCDYKDIYTDDLKIKGVSRRLEVDFYLPKFNLIIELDESQHFTYERAITFKHYENEHFLYNIKNWENQCLKTNKKDSDPPTRDWKRAFRDSIRDLRAKQNNIPLIRLYYLDVNEQSLNIESNVDKLNSLIKQKSIEKY